MTRDRLDAATPFRRVKAVGRALWVLLIGVGLAASWVERAALDPAAIRDAIAAYPAAPLVFLLAHVAASLLFIPRTLLAIAAGLLFGMWWGTFWATLGSVLGAVAGLLVARYVNSGWLVLEDLPKVGPVLRRAEVGGWRSVAALRLIPVLPHSLSNYVLGVTRIGIWPYAIGSLLGQLPMTVAYVNFAVAGGKLAGGQANWVVPLLIGAGALLISVALPKLWRS
jgi:uncharacterized membrane protein YdjX (TVP38/TMEM64 family)